MLKPEQLTEVVLAIVESNKLNSTERVEFYTKLSAKLFGGSITEEAPKKVATDPPVAQPTIVPGGEIWIPMGGTCTCKLCKKAIYRVKKDILERVKGDDFMDSFEPLSRAPAMTVANVYGDPYGNLAVDCPLCKGIKSVWIKGDGEYEGETP